MKYIILILCGFVIWWKLSGADVSILMGGDGEFNVGRKEVGTSPSIIADVEKRMTSIDSQIDALRAELRGIMNSRAMGQIQTLRTDPEFLRRRISRLEGEKLELAKQLR
ncbi:hypothetical protein FEM03_16015 [Phragmitibacter flavus]|uniref:Uncharacterized protein n=1 Tax=Phragmitibacter flavus TaxID=2576071 RepID=A0A5R8KC67_9BACT|nr:hypothetical protein [Phragmitibacter flavus]TLD69827.1 hypothetical protein FEM03_16015 [Phragmitibacter flavus]